MVVKMSRSAAALVVSLMSACAAETAPTTPTSVTPDMDTRRPTTRDSAPAAAQPDGPAPAPPTRIDANSPPDEVAPVSSDASRVLPDAAVEPPPRPVPGTGPVIIAAAGDIAPNATGPALQTATLLKMLIKERSLSAILTMGDNAYPDGTASDFSSKFGPTWGQPEIKTLLRPVPGNHDYHTSGASAYFAYFGNAAGPKGKGYYSYDVGEWHVIALNSSDDCKDVPCAVGSEQHTWLKQDLAANKAKCTLAYWHHPRFQQGSKHGDAEETAPLWDALYDAGADVVLTGHDHNFQQFAPMNKAGELDRARGIRSFVVGTGGAVLYKSFSSAHSAAVEYKQATDFGVLEMTLHADSYEWRFISVKGTEMVKGKDVCR